MVREKKRQRPKGEELGAHSAEPPTKKSKQSKNAGGKQLQPNDEQPQDLLKKLPGENRNAVYDYALAVGDDKDGVKVQILYTRHRRRWFDPYDRKVLRFREPGLLRAAKWIRSEAKAIYYEHKHLEISLTSSETEAACDWLRFVIGTGENALGIWVSFAVTKTAWKDIHSWLPLAKLFRDVEFVVRYNDYAPRDDAMGRRSLGYRRSDRQDPLLTATHFIGVVMNEVILLGLKAKQEDWHDDVLEMEFEEWLERTADEKPASKSSMKGRIESGFGSKHQKMIKLEGGVEEGSSSDGFRHAWSRLPFRGRPQMQLRSR